MVIKKFGPRLLILMMVLAALPVSAQDTKHKKKKKKQEFEEVAMDTMNIFPVDKILDYKATYPRLFNLLHTKLELTPSFRERTLTGKATLKVVPHFYEQAEIVLDAKGMVISGVSSSLDEFSSVLPYGYDGKRLRITFPRVLTGKDTIELHINYTAQPYELDEVTAAGGRGVYFINPEGKNPYKPTMLWTQGEPEAASCWFPTLDATYQKTTQEIYVTVANTLHTLSNGLLISQKNNGDGTRTDYWRQTLPHAPYLFTLVAGTFLTAHDQWNETAVNYHTLPSYLKDVKAVFGNTPEMMTYFSDLLGVKYPWEKYDQVVVYDFTAGAMENTTASTFHESLFCTHRELEDRTWGHDLIIAHELFHQWFGNLVTCENWSQLSLNESFANYSEILWLEKWKGTDDAEVQWYKGLQSYLHEFTYKKAEPITYFYYNSPNDMFDRHRYDKGGRVLHLLRKYLGDDAFFTSLRHYLQKHEFKATEIHDLRIAFEEITGQDLNWFFNQWWFQPGHPIVELSHQYNASNKEINIRIRQRQDNHPNADIPVHRIYLDIDLIYPDTTVRHRVWVNRKSENILLPSETQPLAVNIDPGKMQVWERKDDISTQELLTIFDRSDKILDKIFVVNLLKQRAKDPQAIAFTNTALDHPNWYVREQALAGLEAKDAAIPDLSEQIRKLSLTDTFPHLRRLALEKLLVLNPSKAKQTAIALLEKDSSFTVLSKALAVVRDSSLAIAYRYATAMDQFNNTDITTAVAQVYADTALAKDFRLFERAMFMYTPSKPTSLNDAFYKYLLAVDDDTFQKGLEIYKNIIEHEQNDGKVKTARQAMAQLYNLPVSTAGTAVSITESKKAILSLYKTLIN